MANMHIYCNGGFGNRLGSLFSGLIAADMYGWTPFVIWPTNDHCGANLDDFFTFTPFEHFEELPPVDWPIVTHWPWEGRELRKFEELPSLVGEDIEFNDNSLRYSEVQAAAKLREFVIRPELVSHVDDFCKKHNIDRSVVGYQIRGTDAYKFQQHTKVLNAVNDKSKRFFICSDQKDIEDDFRSFDNVVVHNKNHYTRKLYPEKPWVLSRSQKGNDICVDSNIVRDRDQSIDAFLDMLILARTSLVRSESTFNKWAYVFSTIL